jgi:hypothetical protein
MHKLILPGIRCVDHKNGNGLDNRRCNIREASLADNQHNMRLSIRNKSGYKGVCWDKYAKKWRAMIGVKGRLKNLGSFTTPQEAAAAYNNAATSLYGEFSRLNKIQEIL